MQADTPMYDRGIKRRKKVSLSHGTAQIFFHARSADSQQTLDLEKYYPNSTDKKNIKSKKWSANCQID